VAYGFGNQGFLLMNPTSSCPTSAINPTFGSQSWNQFLATWLAHKLAEPVQSMLDGVFLDNFVEHPSQYINRYQELDFNNDNVADDLIAGDAAYAAGMKDLADQVRQQLPGKLIVSNTGGQAANQGPYLNGGMIEGVSQTWTNSFVGDVDAFYTGWITQAVRPPVFLLEGGTSGGTASAAQTNYKAVRFELGMTLASDGYFVYDEFLTSGGHQTHWWYDEYDNAGAGTGYLGQPLGPSTQPISGVYRRDFANGVSLANNTSSTQTIALGRNYRKINGTQGRSVNDGTIVNVVTLQPRDGIILLSDLDATGPTSGN
jgi:hypothetical protein